MSSDQPTPQIADVPPAWYINLRADPAVVVEVGDERFAAHARVARPDERTELAPLIDYLPRQQQLTKREIPIVIFERD